MSASRAAADDPFPPVAGVRLVVMTERHLDRVVAIETRSFASPWRREHFRHEILENPWAVNRVALRGDELVGYYCVWHLYEELKINNIAVESASRGQGLGGFMLRRILREGRRAGCRVARLEVRPSNHAARGLYVRHGFFEIGRRKGYYEREGEDAIVMEAPLGGDSGGHGTDRRCPPRGGAL
jgi:ribosomal-protein-alanine N-acetyltransferase